MKKYKNEKQFGFYSFCTLSLDDRLELTEQVKLTAREWDGDTILHKSVGTVDKKLWEESYTVLIKMISTRIMKSYGEKYDFEFCELVLRQCERTNKEFERRFKNIKNKAAGHYDMIHVYAAALKYALEVNRAPVKTFHDLCTKVFKAGCAAIARQCTRNNPWIKIISK